jgi:amino acid transporter
MVILIVIVCLLLLFGGGYGGRYYGQQSWGPQYANHGAGLGIVGVVILIVIVLFLLGYFPGHHTHTQQLLP